MNHTLTHKRYVDRLHGVVSESLRDRSVTVVGVGAGSDMVLKLARLGIGHLTFIDPDIVEPENLCRTAYGVDDIGLPKVDALARLIESASPFVSTTAIAGDVTKIGSEAAAYIGRQSDLLIAGTDQFEAQAFVNTLSVASGTPAVFIGVHEKARGGIVVFTNPGTTPCYRCVMKERYSAQIEPETLNLPGAHGSVADVALIDAIALKVAVSLLEQGQDSDFATFLDGVQERTQIVVRAHPAYRWGELDLFDFMLKDLPAEEAAFLRQSAFHSCDTLWLPTDRDNECPDCAHLFDGADQ